MDKQIDNNMKSPFTGGPVYLVEDTEVQDFRKERYTVHVRYYECKDTGEQFTTEEQDEQLCNELYNQYRVRHGIPFPDEIKKLEMDNIFHKDVDEGEFEEVLDNVILFN